MRRKGSVLAGTLGGPWPRKYERIGEVEGETVAMRGYAVGGSGKGALVECGVVGEHEESDESESEAARRR